MKDQSRLGRAMVEETAHQGNRFGWFATKPREQDPLGICVGSAQEILPAAGPARRVESRPGTRELFPRRSSKSLRNGSNDVAGPS